jgi:hypothetical protein
LFWVVLPCSDKDVAGAQIVAVSLAVRHHLAAHTSIKAIRFITNYLLPPPKRAVLAHLGIPLATGETVKIEDCVPIVRKAEVDVSRASFKLFFFDACGNRVTCTELCYMYGTPKAGFGPTY